MLVIAPEVRQMRDHGMEHRETDSAFGVVRRRRVTISSLPSVTDVPVVVVVVEDGEAVEADRHREGVDLDGEPGAGDFGAVAMVAIRFEVRGVGGRRAGGRISTSAIDALCQ